MSGVFDFDTEGAAALEEQARLNPLDPSKIPPPLFAGSGEALKGFLRPSAAAGRAVLLSGAVPVQGAETLGRGLDRLFGYEERAQGSQTDAYFREVVDEVGSSAVDYWTPNPESMGSAAKALNVGTNVIGSLPQMLGTPALFLGTAGLDPATELVRQDVDADTALGVGAVNLGVNALGFRLPAAFGTNLVTRVGTGAGSNLALGAAADAASTEILEQGGYDVQAQGFDATDPYARGLDVLLGVAFGAKAHIDAVTVAQRDAVLATNNNDHQHRRTLPGDPVLPAAAKQHATALSLAIEQAVRGEPVDVSTLIRAEDFVLRPEVLDPGVRTRIAFDDVIDDVLRSEGGYVNDPADRGGETNLGISSRANPDVDVASLTRDGAKAIYRERYWEAIGADQLPEGLRAMAFDAAVNQGVGWTRRALEQANGDPTAFLKLREQHYREIVANDPSQAKFLRGWLNRVGRFRETNPAGETLRTRLVDDPEQLLRDYAQLEDSNGGTVLNTDTARELSPEYLADRTRSADVHEAASDTVKTIYESKLAKPTPEGFDNVVLFTAGGTGAGKTTAIKDAGGAFGKPEIVYDTNMNTLSSAVDKIEQALAAGRNVEIAYVYRDPVEALTGGAIPRAQRQAEKFGTGRTVPLGEHAKTHEGVRPTMEALAERYANDDRVAITAIDNSRGRGQSQIVPLESLPKGADNNLRERLQEALDEAHAGGLAEDLYRGFSAEGRPADAPRTGSDPGAGDGGQPQSPDRGEVSALETPVQAAQRVAAETPDFSVLDGFDADGSPRYRPMSEVMAEIEAEHQQAVNDAQAFPAAINCALRRGFA